jgi:signal transduction histidine kinase
MANVLLVDDDAINRRFVKEVLLKSNPAYDITTSDSGEDALTLMRSHPFDIVLLDVLMPNLDGFEVCRILKEDEALKNIPVLLITGLHETAEMVKGFKLGAADYITKPINVEELCARVSAHLRIKEYHDELVQTQAALVESAKMSAVGSLSAGVAHEFNNILVMMSGYVQLYHASTDLEELHNTIKVIGELVQRGEKIVKGLLDFSRREEYQHKERVQIQELIKQNLSLLDRELRNNGVIVETFFDESVPLLLCYPGQVSQVFVNILRNAIDALHESKRKSITISVTLGAFDHKGVHVKPEKKCATSVLVTVEDTGSGIPEKIKDTLFEPFVTTKGVIGGGNDSKPGTGLGLSLSYGIMKRHKGEIIAENRPNGGARFTLVFPLCPSDSSSLKASE